MTSISTQPSATIYQFPIGGRAGLAATSDDRHGLDQIKKPIGDFAMIDAWYHQDAIRESQPATKQ